MRECGRCGDVDQSGSWWIVDGLCGRCAEFVGEERMIAEYAMLLKEVM